MSKSDAVCYLNRSASSVMAGNLAAAIEALPAKLQRAPADQWIASLKSLVGKGAVKQAEIDDCEIMPWLEAMKLSKGAIERAALAKEIDRRGLTIKEVSLGQPQYSSYSHKALAGPSAVYSELLYIANSERANLQDRIEEVEFELEQFNFDIARLSENPEAVFELEAERAALMAEAPKSYDFSWSHFSNVDAKHGKNLIAHGRELVYGNVYLVDEIQSDWGQRGRQRDWQGISKGPFVTDTKLWAGLVLRRMMQRAALNPAIEKFYWIRGGMCNGGRGTDAHKHDEFYLKIIGGMVDKIIGKAGQKCRLDTLEFQGSGLTLQSVPCFDMTPEVRQLLAKQQPLYSAAALLPAPRRISEQERDALLARAGGMLGSARHIRLVNHLYDIATGKRVAGTYENRIVQVSLSAANIQGAMDHECFHFAMDNLLSHEERQMILREFAPDGSLNAKVREVLLRSNDRAAAAQCVSAEEAAAHGFALWAEGRLAIESPAPRGIFEQIRVVVCDAIAWYRSVILAQKITTPQGVFEHLAGGGYAEYGTSLSKAAFTGLDVQRSQRQAG